MKKLFGALLAFGFSVGYAQTANVNNEPLTSSLDNNYTTSSNWVDFYPLPEKWGQKINTSYRNPKITYVSINVVESSYPGNANWGGLQNPHDEDNGFTFDIVANRHGSTEVADWFSHKAGINPDKNSTFGHSPDKLNFAFKANMVFTSKSDANNQEVQYFCPNVVIAQGHTASYNNWWFAGEQCRWLGKVKIPIIGLHSTDSVVCACKKHVADGGWLHNGWRPVVFTRGTNGIVQNDNEVWVYSGPFTPAQNNQFSNILGFEFPDQN